MVKSLFLLTGPHAYGHVGRTSDIPETGRRDTQAQMLHRAVYHTRKFQITRRVVLRVSAELLFERSVRCERSLSVDRNGSTHRSAHIASCLLLTISFFSSLLPSFPASSWPENNLRLSLCTYTFAWIIFLACRLDNRDIKPCSGTASTGRTNRALLFFYSFLRSLGPPVALHACI